MNISQSSLMHPAYRPDIDGLRAVAVSAVVVHHAFPEKFRTGYIGVDIFFVISGFLITCILMTSLERGQFSLVDFYRRRILRIFPALITMMLAVYLAGWWVLFAGEFEQLGRHILAGAGFVSNLQLWSEAGYFDKSSNEKPLLHLWSLGIEEQFYIIWPGVLWACWSRHMGFLVVTGLLLMGSFAWNLREVLYGHHTADFYSPLSRLWELMAGGCLAYVHQHPAKFPGWQQWRMRSRGLQAWLGLSFLVIGLIVLKGHLFYPGYRALLPVVGTVLLISAGPETWLNRHLLGNRGMVWIGLISYPLYLWHWPLLAIAYMIEGRAPEATLRFAAVVLSVLLAALTYLGIERPLRRGFPQRNVLASVLMGVMLLMAALGGVTDHALGFPERSANANERMLGLSSPVRASGLNQGVCQSIHAVHSKRDVACELYSPSPKFLLVGDSHAGSLSLGVVEHQDRYPSMLLASPGCLPFVDLYVQSSHLPAGDRHCRSLTAAVFMALEQMPSIRSVLLITRGPLYLTSRDFGENPQHLIAMYDGHDQMQTGEAAERAWFEGYDDVITRLEQRGVQVTFMIDWPEMDFIPRACVPRSIELGPRHDCTIARERVDERQHTYRQLIGQLHVRHPALFVYDSNPLFCNERLCSAMRAGILQYLDDDHLNQRGSETVMFDYFRQMPWLP